jgi:TonB family protein
MRTALLIWIVAGMAQATEPQAVEKSITPPKLLHKVEPEYTAEARAKRIEGVVTLSAQINIHGEAVNIKVVNPLDSALDTKAVEAVQQWRFKPAEKDGKPVALTATISVDFKLPRYPQLRSAYPHPEPPPPAASLDDFWRWLWEM